MGYPRKHAYFSAFSLIPARICVSGLWLCARFLAALTHQVYRRVPGQSPAESMFTCSLACVAHGSCDCGSPLLALLMALQLWFSTACFAHGSQLWFSTACVAHGSATVVLHCLRCSWLLQLWFSTHMWCLVAPQGHEVKSASPLNLSI